MLGALILPADLVDRLQTLAGLNPESPTVKVLVNEEDPIKAGLVDDRINALLSAGEPEDLPGGLRTSRRSYLQILLDGGDFSFLGDGISILGLPQLGADPHARSAISCPSDSPDLDELDRVIEFSQRRRRQPRRRRRPAHLGHAADPGRQGGRQRRYARASTRSRSRSPRRSR